jgi:hypothetical protein
MKLSIKRGGGLAGITTRTELESAALPPADARALDEKVSESGLMSMPPEPPPSPSHPDEQLYEVSVDREGGSHTVRLPEGALPDEVRSLIEWADSRPERQQRIVPPGGG